MKNKAKYFFILLNAFLYGFIFIRYILDDKVFTFNTSILLAVSLILTILLLFFFSKKAQRKI